MFRYADSNTVRYTDRLGLYSWDPTCNDCENGADSSRKRRDAIDRELPRYCRIGHSLIA